MALSLAEKSEDDIDYSTDNIILFTWNPSDRKVGYDDQGEMKWDTMILRHLKHLTRVSKRFCIVLELSPTGRHHSHGWFSLDDKYKWNKSVKRHFEMYGNLRVSKMRSSKAFYYYKKEISKTIIDTGIQHVVFCHRNYKSLLGDLKQKYINKAINNNTKAVKPKSILDFAEFALFQDSIE